MVWDGYATYGGAEIINSERARALAGAGGATWYVGPKFPQFAGALEALQDDDDLDVNFADVTQAPWYDPDRADVSSRFYGVFGLGLDYMYDSTKMASVTENSGNGGVIGASRKGSRALKTRAFLLARGRDAMEYGRAWLSAALDLEGCAQDGDCDRADVLFFTEVPSDDVEVEAHSRFLKYTATTSGPFTVEQYISRGVSAVLLEWTWTSERPYVYGLGRNVDLDISPSLALVQDTPINWIKYPSAELERTGLGYTRPVIARNVCTNASLEAATTGWVATGTLITGTAPAAYFTGNRDLGAAALGAYGMMAKIAGNGSTVVSGTAELKITATSDVTTVPAGRLVRASIWAEPKVVAGPSSSVAAVIAEARWLNASNVQVGSLITLATDPSAINVYTGVNAVVPATATKLEVSVRSSVGWSSGATDAVNSDVRLYADGLSVVYFGSA